MHHEVGTEGLRHLRRGTELSIRKLIDIQRRVDRGYAAIGRELQLGCAIAKILPGSAQHFRLTIHRGEMADALGVAVLTAHMMVGVGTVAHIQVPGGLGQESARRKHPRTREPAVINGTLYANARTTGIAHGGEAAHQHLLGHLARGGADVNASVLVFQLVEGRDQGHVGVGIHEARGEYTPNTVDHPGIATGFQILAHGLDQVALNQDVGILQPCVHTVEYPHIGDQDL